MKRVKMYKTFLKGLRKSVSLIVAGIFFISTFDISSAAPIGVPILPDLGTNVFFDLSPHELNIPRNIGTVREIYEGEGEGLIIHLQDAHCNYHAQKNIAEMIRMFYKNHGVDLIGVEGAEGALDTQWFRMFPDEEIRAEVADSFVKKGELTAAEFVAITTDIPITLYGLENEELYLKNLDVFLSCYSHKDSIMGYFERVSSALSSLKRMIYTRELSYFDSKVNAFEDRQLSIKEYAFFLDEVLGSRQEDILQWPNFTTLLRTLSYESDIDFDIVNLQRSDFIEELSGHLSGAEARELTSKSLEFRLGRIANEDFYSFLVRVASEKGIDTRTEYPDIHNYVVYSALYSRIEHEELFRELDDIARSVKESMFTSSEQRKLDGLWRDLRILKGLMNIEIVNEQYEYYIDNRANFSSDRFVSFIRRMSERYGLRHDIEVLPAELENVVDRLGDFYEVAIERDRFFVENLLKGMADRGSHTAVMVAGGFHTKGITDILKEKGVSYVVVMPELELSEENTYISVLTGQRRSNGMGSDTASGTGVMNLAPFLLADLLVKERSEYLRQARDISGFAQEWVTSYVDKWFETIIPKLAELGVDLSDRELVRVILARSITSAADRINMSDSARKVSREERDFVLATAAERVDEIMVDRTKKAPGTEELSVGDVHYIRNFINHKVSRHEFKDIPVNEGVKELLKERAPPGADDLISKAEAGAIVIRVVDNGTRLTFRRSAPGEMGVYDFAYKEDGVLYICVTRAFSFLTDPTNSYYIEKTSKADPAVKERVNATLAQLVYHSYLASLGRTHHEAAAGEMALLSADAKARGVSDIDLFILNQAANEGNVDYLRDFLVEHYDKEKDPSGSFRKALIEALGKAYYLHKSLDEVEKLIFNREESIRQAAGLASIRIRKAIDTSLGAAAKKGGIFKGQDLRGIAMSETLDADVEIPYEVALRLGKSMARVVRQETGKRRVRVAVGKDVRLSSPRIQKGLMEGLLSEGADVVDIGQPYMSTPMASFAVNYFDDIDAAVEITASHNDWTYGGVKVILGKENMSSDVLQSMTAEAASIVSSRVRRGSLETRTLILPYTETVKQQFIEWFGLGERPFEGLTIAVDAAGGVYGFFAGIVRDLGGEVISLNCQPDGYYTSHIPNPVEPMGIAQLLDVLEKNPNAIGVAFDSDGDRIAFGAEGGREVSNHEILCLLARGAEGPVVVNSRASLGVADEMAERGKTAIKARSGYAFIKALARQKEAEIGGEESGHFMFSPDFIDDGILTAGRILGMVAREAREGRSFAEAASSTKYNEYVSVIDRIKIDLKKASERNKNIPNGEWKNINQNIINRLISTFRSEEMKEKGFWLEDVVQPDVWSDTSVLDGAVDGCMVYLGKTDKGLPEAWMLYRPSLSQPDKVYIDLEGRTPGHVSAMAEALSEALKTAVEDIDADMDALIALTEEGAIQRKVGEAIVARDQRIGYRQTKKAPGTPDLNYAEINLYDKLCDDYSEPLEGQDKITFESLIQLFISERGPPSKDMILDFLGLGSREPVLNIRLVDLNKAKGFAESAGIAIEDPRFFPRQDRRLMGSAAYYKQWSDGKKMVSTIFIPKEHFKELQGNPHLAASLIVHEFIERFAPSDEHMTRHGMASLKEWDVSGPTAKARHITEYVNYYLEQAVKKRNIDYLFYLLDTYSPAKDQEGVLLDNLHRSIAEVLAGVSEKELPGYLDTSRKVWLWYRHLIEYEKEPGRIDGTYYSALKRVLTDEEKQDALALGITEDQYKKYSYPIIKMREVTEAVEGLIEANPDEKEGTRYREMVEEVLFKIDLSKDMQGFQRGAGSENYLKEQCDYPAGYMKTVWLPKAPVSLDPAEWLSREFPTAGEKVDEREERLDLVNTALNNLISSIRDKKNLADVMTLEDIENIAKNIQLRTVLSDEERSLKVSGKYVNKSEEEFFWGTHAGITKDEGKDFTKGDLIKILQKLQKRRADLWISSKIGGFVGFLSSQIEKIRSTKTDGRIVVGIAGPGGAGKSTIVDLLNAHFKQKGISFKEYGTDADDYLHPKAVRYKGDKPQRIPWIEAGRMYDAIRLAQHVENFSQGRQFQTLGDPKTGAAAAPIVPRAVNIVEGVYSIHEESVARHYDLTVVLADQSSESDKEKFIRKMNRDARRFGLGRGGFTLPFGFWDYARKQYWEQTDIIAHDAREVADIVWSQDTNSVHLRKQTRRVPAIVNVYRKYYDSIKGALDEMLIRSVGTPERLIAEDSLRKSLTDMLREYDSLDYVQKQVRQQVLLDLARIYPVFSKGILKSVDLDDTIKSALDLMVSDIKEAARAKIKENSCVVIPTGSVGARAYPFSTLGEKGTVRALRGELLVDEPTLLGKAIDRALKLVGKDKVFISSPLAGNARETIAGKMEDGNIPEGNLLVEPLNIDKLVTIGFIALMLERSYGMDPDTVVTIMTPDHHFKDDNAIDKSMKALRNAQISAFLEPVVSLMSITPPVDAKAGHDPRKGYLLKEDSSPGMLKDVTRAKQFIEKPHTLPEGAGWVWNSGKFTFTIRTINEILDNYLKENPDEYFAGLMALREVIGTADEKEHKKEIFNYMAEKMAASRRRSYRGREISFETVILETAAQDSTHFGVTFSEGPAVDAWGDLGTICDRPVNLKQGNTPLNENMISGEKDKIILDDKVAYSNVWTWETPVEMYGVSNVAVAYNSEIDAVVVVNRDRSDGIIDIFETLEDDPALRKYVYRTSDSIETSRDKLSRFAAEGQSVAHLVGSGDAVIVDSKKTTVFSEKGLVAVAGLEDVTVIKKDGGIYVYRTESEGDVLAKLQEAYDSVERRETTVRDLDVVEVEQNIEAETRLNDVKKMLAEKPTNLEEVDYMAAKADEMAGKAAKHFLAKFREENEHGEERCIFTEEDITLLTELVFYDEGKGPGVGKVAKAANKHLEALTKDLKDLYTPKAMAAWDKINIMQFEMARKLEGEWAKDFDKKLTALGIRGEEDYLQRRRHVLSPAPFNADRRQKIKKVLLLSRDKVGGETIISSIAAQIMKSVFPQAKIDLLATDKKFKQVFNESLASIKEVKKTKAETWFGRVDRWFKLVEKVNEIMTTEGLDKDEVVIIDLLAPYAFFGLLPLIENDASGGSYFYFPMTADVVDGRTFSFGATMKRWMYDIFGPYQEGVFIRSEVDKEFKKEAEKIFAAFGLDENNTIAVNPGVGGDFLKSINIGSEETPEHLRVDFEVEIILRLVGDRIVPVVDMGFSPSMDPEKITKEMQRGLAIQRTLEARGIKTAVIEGDDIGEALSRIEDKEQVEVIFTKNAKLGRYAALIEKTGQYVGYDSGFLHVAGGLGKPLNIVFTGFQTKDFADKWNPYSVNYKNNIVVDTKEKEERAAEVLETLMESIDVMRNTDELHNILEESMILAVQVSSEDISLTDAINRLLEIIPGELDDLVMPFSSIVPQRDDIVYSLGHDKKVIADALRLMQMTVLLRNPVIMDFNPVRYEWAGQANRVLYGVDEPLPGQADISEVWHASTVIAGGVEANPSFISGTEIDMGKEVTLPPIRLRELLGYFPSVLGGDHREKPFFTKFLCTRFPNKVHMGFSRKVEKNEFTQWLVNERKNVERLKDSLTEMDFDQFSKYLKYYEQWSIIQADNKWGLVSTDEKVKDIVRNIGKYFKQDVDVNEMLDEIAMQRSQIVGVLNEISLDEGQAILSPAGHPHAIFGLSLQTYPTNVMGEPGKEKYPKNEAWIVIKVPGAEPGQDLILVEPQQTSNDTFSIADFYTPIVWKNDAPAMRKSITEVDIKGFVDKGLYTDRATTQEDFIRTPKDITTVSHFAENARVESLINEKVHNIWEERYFVVNRIVLDGGEDAAARIRKGMKEDSFHELIVTKGEVVLKMEGRKDRILKAGDPIFIPAVTSVYSLESSESSEVLEFYPAEESYEQIESGKKDDDPSGGMSWIGTPGIGRLGRKPDAAAVAEMKSRENEKARKIVESALLGVEEIQRIKDLRSSKKLNIMVDRRLISERGLSELRLFFKRHLSPDDEKPDDLLMIRGFTSLSELDQLIMEKYTNVIISSDQIRRSEIDALEKDPKNAGLAEKILLSRLMVVEALSDIGPVEEHLFMIEIVATAMRLGVLTEKDIKEDTSVYLSLLELMRLFTGTTDITKDDILNMMPSADITARARFENLINRLLMTMPVERLAVDHEEIDRRRQILWSA